MKELMDIAIKQVAGEWIIKHQNMIIKYTGRDVEFGDYLLMQVTHNYVSTLERKFNFFVERKRKEDSLYLEEFAVEELGYSIKDIKDPKFSEIIYKVLKSKKTDYMNIIGKGDYTLVDTFSMAVRNNKKINFDGLDLENGVKKVIPKIRDFDPSFVKNVKEKISKLESQKIEVEKPRERLNNETDEEYENYLKKFYGGGNSK